MKDAILRLAALSHKEALHMTRDRQMVFLAIGMPVVLLVLFGYAVDFDVDEIPVAIVDGDRSPSSRAFAERVDASAAFSSRFHLDDAREIEPLLRRSEITAAFVVPIGFAAKLSRNERVDVQMVLDGADGATARTALGYASALGQRITMDRLAERDVAVDRIGSATRMLYNPEMKSALFVVPGLMAVILAVLGVLLSALSVAREWERGSMEQLFATPVGRMSIVLGKVLPYVVLGLLQFGLTFLAAKWLFGLPNRGHPAAILVVVILFLGCVLGQGLLISMATRSQQLAVQFGALSAILPSFLLSGFLFPVENMPWVLERISAVIPARYMIVCLRGILLEGKSIVELWPSYAALAAFSIAILSAATLKFRRRLD